MESTYQPTLPIKDGTKDGDLIPHNLVVEGCYFFKFIPSKNGGHHIRIELSKTMIMEIAERITQLELEIKDFPHEEIPF